MVACGSSVQQKCYNYALTNLFVWFVQVNCLSIFLVPILELQHTPLPPKCYKLGNVPQLYPSIVFTFRFIVESTKEFGGVPKNKTYLLMEVNK